jgi:hypothetical protein
MRVQVEYFGNYRMPGGCVGCGNPLATHTFDVGNSSWNGKQSVSLKFPVCEECYKASKVNPGWLGCLGGILVGLVGAGIGASLEGLIDAPGVLMIAGGFLGLIAGVMFSRNLIVSRQPVEVRERIARLNNSVRMLGFNLPTFGKGWIKLEFADDNYGRQFMLLNGGKI